MIVGNLRLPQERIFTQPSGLRGVTFSERTFLPPIPEVIPPPHQLAFVTSASPLPGLDSWSAPLSPAPCQLSGYQARRGASSA